MLSQKAKEALKKNWGDKATALDCYAEVKLIDPLSSWACYIFAMDQNEENIHALMYSRAIGVDIYIGCIDNIHSMYNEEGEHPKIDKEYQRMRVSELLKRLRNDS